MTELNFNYPNYAKILHFGLAAFGITAYLTGEFAEDGGSSYGYLIHAYLGLSLAAFMLLRIIRGYCSTGVLSFSSWSVFSRPQWVLVGQDLRNLLNLRIPQRGRHEGLAGLTQALGLLIFGLMALTGTGLFILGNGPESGLFETIETLHAMGESLIPLYLFMHVGAVILHSIAGHPIWQRMFGFKRANPADS